MVNVLLSKLDKVKRTGDGKWLACCPAHEDRSPSLGISELGDGRILLHCYAGCDAIDVVGAVGMSMGDLFPDGPIDKHLRGATPWIGAQRKAQRSRRESLQTILDVADGMRKSGKRLIPKELDQEREAFIELKRLEMQAG